MAVGAMRDGSVLDDTGLPLNGSSEDVEALKNHLLEKYPQKSFCLVEEWTIFRVDATCSDLEKIEKAGHEPLFVFAHKVVHDSRARFQPGDWVRSSMAISFDGVMFETKNTVYVLMGGGQERVANLKTIFSFF
ncbi:DUF6957 family protein [Pseudomonas cucumis]|uniref:DUF6957 family protein n=1 Tax=Pseudomonas cucumis TaxID=2954082 RepID=UPI0027366C36|nr:hypothetical protein [Pseudomonas cucumis]WLG92426.1 hypothetical protein PSH72_10210 [Pseudomonas cucumis]